MGMAHLKAKVAKEGKSDSRGLECLSPLWGEAKMSRTQCCPLLSSLLKADLNLEAWGMAHCAQKPKQSVLKSIWLVLSSRSRWITDRYLSICRPNKWQRWSFGGNREWTRRLRVPPSVDSAFQMQDSSSCQTRAFHSRS